LQFFTTGRTSNTSSDKHRFFMIGDAGLWGGLRHFVSADAGLLPRISPDEFLRRMGQPPSAMAAELPCEAILSGI
jgi:hypothetical protein